MAYSAYVGSFNIDTSVTAGNTQAVTGVGFQPKIVMFWWSGTTATSDGARGEDINFGFGAMVSASERFAIAGGSDDAAATTATFRHEQADQCIVSNLNGTTTIDGMADFSSFDSDGFTLVIDDQFSTAIRVTFLALGGTDLTNVKIGTYTRNGSTGNFGVTGVGFQPDAVLLGSAVATFDISQTQTLIQLGMGTGASNQGVVAMGSNNAAATSDTYGYGFNGEIFSSVFNNAVTIRDSLVSMDADGFTVNQLENTQGWRVHYIALKGGQYHVGELTTRTDGNDIAVTAPGFQPAALLFMSANRALSTQDASSVHLSWSIGAATSTTNRAAQAIWDEDNLADSETATANYDTAAYAHVRDDAIAALMDIKSMDANGFTAVMDDTEPSVGSWVTYLAIGATGGGAADLTAQEIAHSHSLDSAVLTLIYNLTGQEISHGHPLDAVSLTQLHNITAQDISHTHTLDAATLAQVYNLIAQAIDHSHTLDNAVLTQLHNLTGQAIDHSHALDNAVLSQLHNLIGQEISHGHALDNAVLVQAVNLVAQALDHTHALDAVLLTQLHVLTAQEVGHSHSLDNAVLSQLHNLTLQAIDHAHALDNAVLTLGGITLALQEIAHGHALDNALLTQLHNLIGQAIDHVHALDGALLTQLHNITGQEINHSHALDSGALAVAHNLIGQAIDHSNTIDGATLTQLHNLFIQAIEHGHTLEAVVLGGIINIVGGNATVVFSGQGATVGFTEQGASVEFADADAEVTWQ